MKLIIFFKTSPPIFGIHYWQLALIPALISLFRTVSEKKRCAGWIGGYICSAFL